MEQYKIAKREMGAYPIGLSKVSGGIRLCVAAKGEDCRVHIFKAGAEEPVQTLSFPAELRKGDVWNMTILGKILTVWNTALKSMEGCFQILMENALPDGRHGEILNMLRLS